MKVLIISSDPIFLKNNSSGDVWQRHLAYAKSLERLFIVIKCHGLEKLKKVMRGNVEAIPSEGNSSFSILKNLYQKSSAIITKEKIDLINTQDPMIYGLVGYLLKRKHKIPLVMNWHGDFWDNKDWLDEKKINFFLLKLSKFLAKRADKLRVVNPLIKRKLIKAGIDEKKIIVIPTPVNLEKFVGFNEEVFKSLAAKYQDKKVILFVGRLEKEKNLSFFLKSFKNILKEVPMSHFLIVGEGSLRKHLLEIIKKEGLHNRVELLGEVSHEDLASYYRLAKVLILPSRHESFGKVILEAAMQKTPTLASKTTGATSIIFDKKLLFDIDNQNECYRKMTVLLVNEELRVALGNKLFEEIKNNYSWFKSVESVSRMWQKIIADEPHLPAGEAGITRR